MRNSEFIQVRPEQLREEVLRVVKQNLTELSKSFPLEREEEYLTREEVAKLLKVDKSTVSNWKKAGTIHAYGIGGRVYYKRSEIDMAMIKIN